MNPQKMVIGEKYKIKRNNKIAKVVLKSISDSSIVVMKNWKEQQIPLKEITNMKKRKFSIVKTIALIPIAAVTLAIVFVLSDPIKINVGSPSPN